MNIHPSLLPSFKGLHAQKQAVDAGVKVSGCTVHFVDNYVDHGPIILQKCVPVFDRDNESLLSDRILKEEHKIYTEAINLFVNNKLQIKDNKVFIN
jgi:phosphoribosylglycinamide formyltransferase-1